MEDSISLQLIQPLEAEEATTIVDVVTTVDAVVVVEALEETAVLTTTPRPDKAPSLVVRSVTSQIIMLWSAGTDTMMITSSKAAGSNQEEDHLLHMVLSPTGIWIVVRQTMLLETWRRCP
jgi:hypothetical protein